MEDRIRIIVEAEVQRAIANLRQAQREARNTASSFQQSSRQTGTLSAALPKLSAGMAAIGVSAAAAGAALATFAKSSYNMAAEVQASTQVINRLFGENAKQIEDFAKSASENFGISERAAKKYSATYGNLLSSFIKDGDTLSAKTQEILQYSASIAAATGKSIEEVNERIRSGLLGETESIEDLGINVKTTFIESTEAFREFAGNKSWAQLDNNMQQQALLMSILDQAHEKYGKSINDNVISRTNQAKSAFENFQTTIGEAFLPYMEEFLNNMNEVSQSIVGSESNMNALVGTIQVLIETLLLAWNTVGMFVDAMKAGAATILQIFLNPIINGIASLSEALANLKIPGLDMSSYQNVANTLRGVSQSINNIVAETTTDTKENFQQMADNISNIWDILNGNIKKSTIKTKEEVKKVVKETPPVKLVDEKELERIQDILLQFEIDYRETMGRNEEAARLSIEAQKKIYEEAGVDRVRLEEWADMQILRSKTDLLSGIKRGFHDLALESSDYATQMESLLSSAFQGAEDALTDFVTTGEADFKAFAESILKEIARMAIKMAIIAPLQRAFSGMFNGTKVGSAGTGTSAVSSNSVSTSVKHSGGMVESAGASRSVPMSLFAGAPRFHNGGMLAPDEVPIIAQKGERVLNREETKAYNSGRGVSVPVNVVVNNNNGSNVDVKQSSNNQGGMDIEVIIGDTAAKQAAKKGTLLNKAITNNNKQELIKR